MISRGLPIAVIGAGPIGLAAAAHLIREGQSVVVIEAAPVAAPSVRAWGHIRMLTPWKYNVSPAARDLLNAADWREPVPDDIPTGRDWVGRYLEPLAALPALHPHIVFRTTVTAVTRQGLSKSESSPRAERPFTLHARNDWGSEFEITARAVIDASGTWTTPNPAGANGILAAGEVISRSRIKYRVPDASGDDRARYAGKHILVLGSGDSALNALVELAALKERSPETKVVWAMRREQLETVLGAPDKLALPTRADLCSKVRRLVTEHAVEVLMGFHLSGIAHTNHGSLEVTGQGSDTSVGVEVDEVIALTGFRPDLSFLSELRISLDPCWECARGITTLIDPTTHSNCSVMPHGATELVHPEPDFYIVGSKSYGRASTFLAMRGHDQVRSVTFAIAGNDERPVDDTWPERINWRVPSIVPIGVPRLSLPITTNGRSTQADMQLP